MALAVGTAKMLPRTTAAVSAEEKKKEKMAVSGNEPNHVPSQLQNSKHPDAWQLVINESVSIRRPTLIFQIF